MQFHPRQVLEFWLEECSPDDWYQGGEELDAAITDRFEAMWEAARDGRLERWRATPEGALAFLILTDQFPRNMFRGQAKAFSTDKIALSAAKKAIDDCLDTRIEGEARQFFYLPLEHSECLTDQERAVRLICTRMDAPETLLHARAHREVIRTFGRFPFRNDALGRETGPRESVFLEEGGYGAVVREMREG